MRAYVRKTCVCNKHAAKNDISRFLAILCISLP